MLRSTFRLFRFDPGNYVALLGVSVFLIAAPFISGTGVRWTVLWCLVVSGQLGNAVNDPKRRRLHRSLPVSRGAVTTAQWFMRTIPIPLFVGLIGTICAGMGKVAVVDVLFFVALSVAVTSSTAFLSEINDLWASHADNAGRLGPLRMKARHAGILALAIPVGLFIHPVRRASEADWFQVLMLAAGCCLFVLSLRWREHLWADFMPGEKEDDEPCGLVKGPLTFPSRRRSRIREWNKEWLFNVRACAVVYAVAALILYGAPLFGKDLWPYKHWVGIAAGVVSLGALITAFNKQDSSLRAYRMLPMTARGLLARLLYRYAINFAMLLIPACLFVPVATNVSIPDVLLAAWAVLAALLTLSGAAFVEVKTPLLGVILAICGVGAFFLPFLLMPSIHTAIGLLAVVLTVGGIWLHHAAITHHSGGYRSRSLRESEQWYIEEG